MQGCFLTQRVIKPTRGVNVLDLVLSSLKELINDLSILEPLRKSGHSQIHFSLMINTGNGRSKQNKRDFQRRLHKHEKILTRQEMEQAARK